jgi:hypothetical protein
MTAQWRIDKAYAISSELSQYAEAGKLKQELLLAGILEADVGLGVLACALDAEHLADAEALMFDELAWGELGYTGGTSRGIGRDETTR